MARSVTKLLRHLHWRPIPGCPGRFVLTGGATPISPAVLAGVGSATPAVSSPEAHDPVVVQPLSGGGLISYRKPAGTYVHTLCTVSGFRRKLEMLCVEVPA